MSDDVTIYIYFTVSLLKNMKISYTKNTQGIFKYVLKPNTK